MGNYDPGRTPPSGMPGYGSPQPSQPLPARPIPLQGGAAPQPIPLSQAGMASQPLPAASARSPIAQPQGLQSPTKPVLREATPDEAERNPELEKVVRSAPPWLVSGIVHMVVLIVLGLWMLALPKDNTLSLEVVYSDEEGEQLDEEAFEIASEDLEMEEQIITPDNLLQVEDPLQAPFEVELSPLANVSTSKVEAPQIGMLLKGRTPGMKSALLRKYGGTKGTEDAVMMALGWLARNQNRDGSWTLDGPFPDGSRSRNPYSATAMALLAFQGAGHTHQGPSKSPFSKNVARGWEYLRKQQDEDGNFYREGASHEHLYTQAQCTIAICELYGMTQDVKFQQPAQLAVDYCVAAQSESGGWRYVPRQSADTSVTGWFVMALQSAKMAYLQVPDESLERIGGFLDKVQADGGSRYGYQGPSDVRPSMTAEGLLCRQYLGWEHDDERLLRGVQELELYPLDYNNARNVYYWYYATQVMHHMEGAPWEKWNNVMREVLPAKQIKNGSEKGSWDPNGDQWGPHGGRLYVTCLHTYMLEVYYRHLPIYQHRLGDSW